MLTSPLAQKLSGLRQHRRHGLLEAADMQRQPLDYLRPVFLIVSIKGLAVPYLTGFPVIFTTIPLELGTELSPRGPSDFTLLLDEEDQRCSRSLR